MRFPLHKAPASGAQALIGYDIDLSADDGSARVMLEVQAQHLNRNGTLHGGIHAMMLDAAAGFAASRRLAGETETLVPVVTLSLNTSFLAPAGLGVVEVRGWATGGGYKIVYGEAEVLDANGAVCSRASGVFRRAG